jgi:zinc transporter ZupT
MFVSEQKPKWNESTMVDDDVKIRVFIAVATFLVGFLSASAPLKVIHVDAHLFSCGNLMASGVLLSAGIVHQLPDSIEKFESSPLSDVFPVAPFITGLTFCLFLILEEYIHMHFDDHPFLSHGGPEGKNADDHNGHVHEDTVNGDTKGHCHQKEEDPLLRSSKISNRRERSISDASWVSIQCPYDGDSVRGAALLESFRSKSGGHEHHHHHDPEHVAEHIHGSLLASMILLLALSIHSVFDGLAIGISSDTNELIATTAAVLAHKGFAGYALGSSMTASEMNERHYFALVAVFASCSVVGILLGTIFEHWDPLEVQTGWKVAGTATINAIVAGTFLYISIVEIGMKEILVCRDSTLLGNKLDRNQMQWNKLAAFLLGYLAMSSLAVFI